MTPDRATPPLRQTLKLFRVSLLLAVALFFASAAHAQLALYGTFEADRYSTADKFYKGGTVGLYDDLVGLGPVHLGVDVRGSILNGSNSNRSTKVLAGVRVAVKPPLLPIRPYAEVLAGTTQTDINALPGIRHTVGEAVGGIDFTFFPHLDWRVVEAGGQIAGSSANKNFHVGTGLVVRFF